MFLRYSLLVDLMSIVKKHGRNPDYDFEKDDKLSVIKDGKLRKVSINERNKVILSIDGFMTIWLLTLPEKFIEWYLLHNESKNKVCIARKCLPLQETPTFPYFPYPKKFTYLAPNEETKTYDFLPSG